MATRQSWKAPSLLNSIPLVFAMSRNLCHRAMFINYALLPPATNARVGCLICALWYSTLINCNVSSSVHGDESVLYATLGMPYTWPTRFSVDTHTLPTRPRHGRLPSTSI